MILRGTWSKGNLRNMHRNKENQIELYIIKHNLKAIDKHLKKSIFVYKTLILKLNNLSDKSARFALRRTQYGCQIKLSVVAC